MNLLLICFSLTSLAIVTTAAVAASLAGYLLHGFGLGVPVQEIDLADTFRQLELKQIVAQLGVHVPAVDECSILRLVYLPLEGDQELARQRLLAGLDPDLPIQKPLPERQVMALHLTHVVQP